jgi:hypothetical protein
MATRSTTLAGWLTFGSGLKIPDPRCARVVVLASAPRNTSLAEMWEYSSKK